MTTSIGTKRAAVYIRVSSDKQEDGYSLGFQERDCRQYASDRDLEVAEVYRETHTGIELWERPELTRLRAAIQRHEVDAIIFHTLDRFSRDPVHQQIVMMEAAYHDVAVHCALEAIDDTDTGKLVQYIKGWKAKQEWTDLRRRTQAGLRARVESGKPMVGHKPPYGYRWANAEKSHLYIEEAEAVVLRDVFAQAATGRALRSIAIMLNDRGVATPTGKGDGWRHTTIRRIIRNPIYCGRPEAFRVTCEKVKGLKDYRTQPSTDERRVLLPSDVAPAIVDDVTFAAIQQRLATNKLRAVRNAKNPEDALLRGGYAKCGTCKHTMIVARHHDVANYRCSMQCETLRHCKGNYISARILDAAVWQRVHALLTDPEVVARELARLTDDDPTTDDVAAVERALRDVTKQQANTASAIAQLDDTDAAAPLLVQLRSLSERRRDLDSEHAAVLQRRAQWEAAQSRVHELRAWCDGISDKIDSFDWDQKRRLVLDALGVTVSVFGHGAPERYIIRAGIPMAGEVVDTTACAGVHNDVIMFRWSDADCSAMAAD